VGPACRRPRARGRQSGLRRAGKADWAARKGALSELAEDSRGRRRTSRHRPRGGAAPADGPTAGGCRTRGWGASEVVETRVV
jgi:hypothetical protein